MPYLLGPRLHQVIVPYRFFYKKNKYLVLVLRLVLVQSWCGHDLQINLALWLRQRASSAAGTCAR